jgi:hypothetical protein
MSEEKRDELRIVILTKGPAASIGVQSPNCDPVFVTLTGDLPAVLQSVPEVVAAAKQKWETSPRYPKCETPAPAPEPAAAGTAAAPRRVGTPAPAKESPKIKMF